MEKKNKFLQTLYDNRMKRLGKVVEKQENYAHLSLAELKEKFPHIKARSKAKFIEKLES